MKNDGLNNNYDELRKKAERIWEDKDAEKLENSEEKLGEEISELIQELQVHQIELELQNEELRETQAELEEARTRYYELYDLAPVGYCTLSREGEIKEINLAGADILDESRTEVLQNNKRLSEFILSRDQNSYYFFLKNLLETGEPQKCELRLKFPQEKELWVGLQAKILHKDREKPPVLLTMEDITERKKMEEQLRIKEEQYRKIFETAPVGILLRDSGGNILEVNDSLCEITGYDKKELIGNSVLDTLTPVEKREKAKENRKKILSGKNIEYQGYRCRKNGEKYHMHLYETQVTLPKNKKGILSIQLDMTELKRKKERLEYISYHDELTGLYNRSFLQEEMKRLNTERQHPISLIYCDINCLKIINDTYGHEIGDEILIKTAQILQQNTREEDIVTRLAGDEFVILLPQTDENTAREIVKRIGRGCEGEEYKDIPLSLGIGMETKNKKEIPFADILKKADGKMYRDKLTKTRQAKNKIIQNMLVTLEGKSMETKEHFLRMNKLATKIGNKIGLDNEQINNLTLVSPLHDIGKVTISQDILTSPEKLTAEEWEIIKEHPEKGFNIASATEDFASVARVILHHHERWDGQGYPEGLKGTDIPLLSRIISLVDAYDVMTAGRPYKDAIDKETAIKEILDCAGSQFDPELAREFIKIIGFSNRD